MTADNSVSSKDAQINRLYVIFTLWMIVAGLGFVSAVFTVVIQENPAGFGFLFISWYGFYESLKLA